jgi:predicted RecB family nuclease
MLVGNPSLSWNELIFTFIKCDFKAYLKLQGRTGQISDIERQLQKKAKEHRRTALKKVVENHDASKIVDSPTDIFDTLCSGPSIITNAIITYQDIQLYIDVLLINQISPLNSKKPYEIRPVMFLDRETLSKEDKTWAVGVTQVISRAIVNTVPRLSVIYGARLRHTTIAIADRKHSVTKILNSISKIRDGEELPILRLKSHCNECEFQSLCYKKALEADDLSLIQAMTKKDIKKLNARGIFTTTQYSYTFRPRKQLKSRDKKHPKKHNLALQALAKRTNTIYIAEYPDIPSTETAVYVDIEGIPDQKLYYLLGLRVVTKGSIQRYSFWADSKTEEEELWTGLIRVLEPLKDYQIFHYGAYEIRAFRRLAKRYGVDLEVGHLISEACFNVLSAIYGYVHFPTFSNSLKDIASTLGFVWNASKATGIQSLAWRYAWEESHSSQLKQKLITYNENDCQALQLVTETLFDLLHTDSNEPKLHGIAVSTVGSLETKIRPYATLIQKDAVFPELVRINDCSYYSYQRARVEIRTDSNVRRSVKRERKDTMKHRANKRVVLDRVLECPDCGNKSMKKNGKLRHRKHDLKITDSGIKRWIIETVASRYRCWCCGKAVSPEEYHAATRNKYGRILMAWVVYKHICHSQSYSSIVEELRDVFGYSIPRGTMNHFRNFVASHCRSSYQMIKEHIQKSPVIYADETKAKAKKSVGYVWVFTTPNMVYYLYKNSREGDFLHEQLNDFNGVLVSDFYAAYDSVQCEQQKCLIHLIRDLNDDVFRNPFDEELKSIARRFRIYVPEVGCNYTTWYMLGMG